MSTATRSVLLSIVAAAGIGRQPAFGQAGIEVDAWVRVIGRADGASIYGRVRSVARDTLWIDTSSGYPGRVLVFNELTSLEVRTGVRSNALRGLGIGGLVGAGLGVGLVLVGWGEGTELTLGDRIAAGGVTLAALGAAAGLFVGSFTHHDVWRSVPLGRGRLAVTLGPNRVGGRLSF